MSEAIPTARQRFELTSSALWSKSSWLGNGSGFTASRKCAPRHDESDLTTRNSAEGPAGDLKIAKNHEFSKVDQPKVRRGSRKRFQNRKKPRVFEGRPAQSPSRGRFQNRKKPRVFEGRPARSPQRVAQTISKSQKTTSFRGSTSPKSAEGRAGDFKIAKNHEFSKVDQPKVRRGLRGRFENRKKPRVFEGRQPETTTGPRKTARQVGAPK